MSTADLLQSPAGGQGHGSSIDSPVTASSRNAPPSPALNREQIKSRSSRGWSASNGGSGHGTTSSLSIPPLNFRSKHAASSSLGNSAAMGRTTSTESSSTNNNGMSPLDAGSPFANILGQFQSPALESVRKSSGSYKVLDKKAVSNSPFLTGGNTRSATGAAYSPASAAASPRKQPFAPSSSFASWRNGPESNSNPPSPARNGLHGLGVFSNSSNNNSPAQNNTPSFSTSRPNTHRRGNSDVENSSPFHHHDKINFDKYGIVNDNNKLSVSGPAPGEKPDLSPATKFNAEMETLALPRAIDVTRGRSDSDVSSASSGLLPQLHGGFAEPPVSAIHAQRKPRQSVAALGNRATVSNSPFLSHGGPPAPTRQNSNNMQYPLPISSIPMHPVAPQQQHQHQHQQPTSSLASPRRNMLGPREPSLTDLKARAAATTDEQDILSDYYGNNNNDDEPLTQLTEHALERKASKKSVKWAEMEEVCEYDVMTEDGDTSSRRSSSTGSYNNYGDNSYEVAEDDEETKAQVQEILRQHGVQDLDVFGGSVKTEETEDDFYEHQRHTTITAKQEDLTPPLLSTSPEKRDGDLTPGRGHLPRDASVMSQQASIIEDDEVNHSGSSFENDGEAEIQQLIDQVEKASMSGRGATSRIEDVFGSPIRQDEFGMRTPHSSMGAESTMSLGTPQPLNRNGSLSRRPLPSPPILPIDHQARTSSPSPSKFSERSKGDSTERHSFLLNSSTMTAGGAGGLNDSLFSLPDLGLGGTDSVFDLKEMGLTRKESMKRSPGINCYNGQPASRQQQDKEELLLPAAGIAERSTSPKPFLTAEDVRNSLRRKPSLLSHLQQDAPLASTPTNGSTITSPSGLPPAPLRKLSDDTPSASVRSTPNKAISARPAPMPMKISSDQLPTFRTSTPQPQPSPIKEPESALDRLVREAAAGNAEAVHALKGNWAQAYSSASTSSATRPMSMNGTLSAAEVLKARDDALLAAKKAKKGLSASAGPIRRRRSLSTGDDSIESIEIPTNEPATPPRESTPSSGPSKARRAQTAPNSAGGRLATSSKNTNEPAFGKQLGQALDNVVDFHDRGYRVKEQSRGVLAYSGSNNNYKVATVGDAGDVDAGGAWKKVRRPSDIYEHRTQIREYKQSSASKARHTGALFVKIGKLRTGRDLPIPAEATFVACELFNGLDHVTTGVSRLAPETEIQQEFELIAHPNLEVTLSFKVRKDASKDRHLFPRPQSTTPASPSSKHMHTGSTSGGFRTGLRNLLSSPKKNKARPASAMEIRASSPSPVFPAHPLLDYLASDGELCRVSFKAETFIGACTGKRLKTVHQCKAPERSRRITGSAMELEISLFYLPPLPNVPVDKLPQSIDECLEGLLKADRHDKILFQGILTQMGADCAIWRRRWFTLKGSRLIAYNEVTRQAHALFDLAQAVKLDDPDEEVPATPANSLATPATTSTTSTSAFKNANMHRRTLSFEDDEGPYSTRPNSFRIHFEDSTFIDLCADEDKPEEKAKWLVYLKPIINRDKKMKGLGAPPLWAQALKESMESKAKKDTSVSPPLPQKK